jgi:hypothetical protein
MRKFSLFEFVTILIVTAGVSLWWNVPKADQRSRLTNSESAPSVEGTTSGPLTKDATTSLNRAGAPASPPAGPQQPALKPEDIAPVPISKPAEEVPQPRSRPVKHTGRSPRAGMSRPNVTTPPVLAGNCIRQDGGMTCCRPGDIIVERFYGHFLCARSIEW